MYFQAYHIGSRLQTLQYKKLPASAGTEPTAPGQKPVSKIGATGFSMADYTISSIVR
jgi:hypothetical protein